MKRKVFLKAEKIERPKEEPRTETFPRHGEFEDGICTRCGRLSLGGNWEYRMFRGKIRIERDCQIFMPWGEGLKEDGFDAWKEMTNNPLFKTSEAQLMELKWSNEKDDYHLCRHCHDELIGMLAKFFWKAPK